MFVGIEYKYLAHPYDYHPLNHLVILYHCFSSYSYPFLTMKYSFGLLALAGLAVATPVQKRQDIDFDAYNSVPSETPIAAPEGVTAAQSTTLPYNPTTTSGFEKRDTPIGVLTSGCTAAVQAGNAPLTSPDTPQDFLANSVYSSAALNAQTPNGYTVAFSNQFASAADNPFYLTYTTKGMTSYDPNICASLCTDEVGCFSFNICKCSSNPWLYMH